LDIAAEDFGAGLFRPLQKGQCVHFEERIEPRTAYEFLDPGTGIGADLFVLFFLK
jgi:hypothetical protein